MQHCILMYVLIHEAHFHVIPFQFNLQFVRDIRGCIRKCKQFILYSFKRETLSCNHLPFLQRNIVFVFWIFQNRQICDKRQQNLIWLEGACSFEIFFQCYILIFLYLIFLNINRNLTSEKVYLNLNKDRSSITSIESKQLVYIHLCALKTTKSMWNAVCIKYIRFLHAFVYYSIKLQCISWVLCIVSIKNK